MILRRKRIWRYKLSEILVVQLPQEFGLNWFESKYAHLRADGALIIHKGYAWDGASPSIRIAGLGWIGTPEGAVDYHTGWPLTYIATAVHDALTQYQQAAKLTNKEVDFLFYKILCGELKAFYGGQPLSYSPFPLARLYYNAVRLADFIGLR